jgi:hypothetical protein
MHDSKKGHPASYPYRRSLASVDYQPGCPSFPAAVAAAAAAGAWRKSSCSWGPLWLLFEAIDSLV